MPRGSTGTPSGGVRPQTRRSSRSAAAAASAASTAAAPAAGSGGPATSPGDTSVGQQSAHKRPRTAPVGLFAADSLDEVADVVSLHTTTCHLQSVLSRTVLRYLFPNILSVPDCL